MTPILALGPPDAMILFSRLARSQACTASHLVVVQAHFLVEHRSRVRILSPPAGIVKSPGSTRLHAVKRGVDRGRRFDRILEAFEADPDAGEAAHREADSP